MILTQHQLDRHNEQQLAAHQKRYWYLSETLPNAEAIVQQLVDFQIAIPSWALGTGGTRFGRFPGGGEPTSLEQKIEDVGLLHALNRSSGAISLHIPWDIPSDSQKINALADSFGLTFDAVNSNTFQDQADQKETYKFGSLQNVDAGVRRQAIEHNIECIRYGQALGSTALTVWLSDGSCFPGQQNFRKAFTRTLDSLGEIYNALPTDSGTAPWQMFVEYKPYEPNFYSMVVGDWGASYLYCSKLGKQADCLVDFGHHLPNANIEQIVALLMNEKKLGGFHFNDSKYGDDDLTVGSMKPYQLFLVFNELVEGMTLDPDRKLAWMIDASHNVKDPLEDLLQSVEAIKLAYAQALCLDRTALADAQDVSDVVRAQELLQDAFRTDVRPLVAEARLRAGAALNPIGLYRDVNARQQLIQERGLLTRATGL